MSLPGQYTMKKLKLLLVLPLLGLASCVTSDPMQGGFFFDEAAAYQRLDQKQQYLHDLQAEEADLRRQAR
jgi:hypothetical protein